LNDLEDRLMANQVKPFRGKPQHTKNKYNPRSKRQYDHRDKGTYTARGLMFRGHLFDWIKRPYKPTTFEEMLILFLKDNERIKEYNNREYMGKKAEKKRTASKR
jgi:hypothetical protein